VWVKGAEISSITLRPSYHLVVSGVKKAVDDSGILAESASASGNGSENEKTTRQLDRWLFGSDGRKSLSGNFFLVILLIPATHQ
jgi:hypothetical protein